MKKQDSSRSVASTPDLTPSRVFINHPLAISKLKKIITRQLKLNYQSSQQLIVLCVGTDRSTGDALGPLVGSKLKKFHPSQINLLGTLENPIHAVNLQEKITAIKEKYKNPFIIAVDASLGKKQNIGAVDVKPGPLQPGSGVDKKLPKIGDLHITGLVNIAGCMEYLVLQSTRLNFVLKMSRKIAYSIINSVQEILE